MEPKDRQSPLFLALGLPFMRALAWFLMIVLGPFRRYGANRVPKKGGILILANHLSDIDPIIVQLACKRPIYFMAKSELFEMKGVRYILKVCRAFPVKRGEPDRTSLKHAISLLRDGQAVCVYPEGELSESGDLLPLKPGVALIVRQAEASVICLGITGSGRVMPYGTLIPRPAFHTMRARWGEPRAFTKEDSAETILEWATQELLACTGQPPASTMAATHNLPPSG